MRVFHTQLILIFKRHGIFLQLECLFCRRM